MEPQVFSDVRIKREADCYQRNSCEGKSWYNHEADYPDNESCCSSYSRGSSSPGKNSQGQGTKENHLVDHLPNVECVQRQFVFRKQLDQMQDAERVPSSESITQVAQLHKSRPDLTGCGRRKRSLPTRFHDEYFSDTEEKCAWATSHGSGLNGHLIRPQQSLSDRSQSCAAYQVNAWPPYTSPARPTLVESTRFQPTPVVGKAFHVHTFTPGPPEIFIVCQPEEVLEMSPRNQVQPEAEFKYFDEHATAVQEAPISDSGFSDDDAAGSKESEGVMESGSCNFTEPDRGLFSEERRVTDELEEQRQWSQVNWYRDLKKPNKLRKRDQNTTEQTIFMRCNELKERRKREAQRRSNKNNAYEAMQNHLPTPLSQHSTCTAADSDMLGPSPTRRHLSHEQSDLASPGNLERIRDDGSVHEQHGLNEQILGCNARNTSVSGQPCYSCSSTRETLKEHLMSERNEVSPYRKEDESDSKQDTSSSKLMRTSRKTANSSSSRGARTGENVVVCQVNGLFALPGFKDAKYNITLDELQRRAGNPENLNRVEMISYVRQAKSSGRTLLDKYNVITTSRSNPTIMSRVCEREARVLADGIHEINTQYLPMQGMAGKTVDEFRKRECNGNQDCGFKLRRRVVDIEITRNVLKEMRDALVDHDQAGDLRVLELASHGFGVVNLDNHLKLLDTYFGTLMQHLQGEAGKHTR